MKNLAYKITLGILLVIIVLQWMVISARKPPKKPLKAPVVKALKGRIAIVLDDWGYNLNNIPIALQIKYPVTASILPNLYYSKQVAKDLHNHGFEIILHLPMEPTEKFRLEKNTILTSLNEQDIKKIVDTDLFDLVFADGVSNHMGSSATADRRVMEIVFRELKNKHMFFLDSFVTPKSVCFELSRKAGIPFAARDVFLDNTEEPEYIRQQIYKLKVRAGNKGYAVGIGHDRKITLQVLKEVMPQLEKEGFKFVYLSEVVR